MKDLKIGKKFLVTFGIIIALFFIVVITSILSLKSTGDDFDNFYETGYEITNKSMDMRRTIQSGCANIGYATMASNITEKNTVLN